MWDWVDRNKEWFFSGLGISLGLLVVRLFNKITSRSAAQRPFVQVMPGLVDIPSAGMLDVLGITILNPTDKSLFLGNVMLELNTKHSVFIQRDLLTGEGQRKRELKPGDSFSFHITRPQLVEVGKKSTDYICALVEDAAGPPHRSTTKEVQTAIRCVLSEKN